MQHVYFIIKLYYQMLQRAGVMKTTLRGWEVKAGMAYSTGE